MYTQRAFQRAIKRWPYQRTSISRDMIIISNELLRKCVLRLPCAITSDIHVHFRFQALPIMRRRWTQIKIHLRFCSAVSGKLRKFLRQHTVHAFRLTFDKRRSMLAPTSPKELRR